MVVESKVEVPPQVELTIFWTCVLFSAQVFRSSQSASQVSREKSPMVVGGLSLMSEFSQSATTTRAEPTPRDATYLPVAASSASSSELNRTTDGSRPTNLPTYLPDDDDDDDDDGTVPASNRRDPVAVAVAVPVPMHMLRTGERARAREQYRESEPNRVLLALSMGAARSVRLVSSSLVAGGRSKLARKTLQGGRQCAWTGRKMFRKQRYPTGRWSTYREHTEPQPAMDDGSWKDATAQRRHRGVYNTTGNDLYARRWMNDANDALHRTVRPGWASSVHVVRTTPTGHITTSGSRFFAAAKSNQQPAPDRHETFAPRAPTESTESRAQCRRVVSRTEGRT